ncbi:hypothetical protein BH11ARM1_BH11ARM1_10810 [soil metagenome]
MTFSPRVATNAYVTMLGPMAVWAVGAAAKISSGPTGESIVELILNVALIYGCVVGYRFCLGFAGLGIFCIIYFFLKDIPAYYVFWAVSNTLWGICALILYSNFDQIDKKWRLDLIIKSKFAKS